MDVVLFKHSCFFKKILELPAFELFACHCRRRVAYIVGPIFWQQLFPLLAPSVQILARMPVKLHPRIIAAILTRPDPLPWPKFVRELFHFFRL